jgi:hypothetical protein
MNPIEKAAAKMAGKTANVEARIKGLTGVFAKLAEQHHEASALLSSLEKATDHTKRRDLWRQIRKDLLSHEQAELLEIYPVLDGYAATREIAQLHAEQAGELEELIGHVDLIAVQSDGWRPALQRLIVKVGEHVAEEEKSYFPQAQHALGEERVKKLEQPYLRAQERMKERLG